MTPENQITAPVAKAATAITAGAGTSAISIATTSSSFLPTDLAGWIAVLASSLAAIYTICILIEWWWVRFWRPYAVRKGWMPKPHGTAFRVDSDGNVTREDV
jgi:hypothetical protein